MDIEIPDLEDLEFEESCRSCTYLGKSEPDCDRCDGTGVRPNPVGARLLEFLDKHGFVQKKGS